MASCPCSHGKLEGKCMQQMEATRVAAWGEGLVASCRRVGRALAEERGHSLETLPTNSGFWPDKRK